MILKKRRKGENTVKDKLRSFMYGRYGNDSLNTFLLVLAIVCFVLSIFGSVFKTLSLLILIFAFYRLLSKNFEARRKENAAFLRVFSRFEPKIRLFREKIKDKGRHKMVLCPSCGKILRVPKNKGNITVHCPCGLYIKTKS